jgi:hypothetical protein
MGEKERVTMEMVKMVGKTLLEYTEDNTVSKYK